MTRQHGSGTTPRFWTLGGGAPTVGALAPGLPRTAGTLELSALASLSPGQTWLPILYGLETGKFAQVMVPQDGNPNWAWAYWAGAFEVTN